MLQRVIYIVNECFMRSYSYKILWFFSSFYIRIFLTSCQPESKEFYSKNIHSEIYKYLTDWRCGLCVYVENLDIKFEYDVEYDFMYART